MVTRLAVVVLVGVAVACSTSTLDPAGGTGKGGAAGAVGGTGGSPSGAAGSAGAAGCEFSTGEAGCGVCPAGSSSAGPMACAAGSTAFSCALPGGLRKLLVSNDHAYAVLERTLYRIDDAGPTPIVDIAIGSDRHEPSDVQVDEPYVYFAEANYGNPAVSTGIWRRRLDGSDAPATVWNCSGYVNDFVVDGDGLVLRSFGGTFRIEKRAPAVQASVLYFPGYNPGYNMAVDADHIYWASVTDITQSTKTSSCACACAGQGAGTGASVCSSQPMAGNGLGGAGGSGGPEGCAQPSQLLSGRRGVAKVTPVGDFVYFLDAGTLY